MNIRKFAFAATLALLALPAAAADGVAGKWNASVDSPQGPFAMVFEFAVDGGSSRAHCKTTSSARFRSRTAR